MHLVYKMINYEKWKPFNLFIANNKKAYWIKSTSKNKIEINNIPEGKHFLDSHDINSNFSDRYNYNKIEYKALKDPKPDIAEWDEWIKFLSKDVHPEDKPLAAMNINNKYIENYGTICSAIVALPEDKEKAIFLFNDSSPDKNNFYSINTC